MPFKPPEGKRPTELRRPEEEPESYEATSILMTLAVVCQGMTTSNHIAPAISRGQTEHLRGAIVNRWRVATVQIAVLWIAFGASSFATGQGTSPADVLALVTQAETKCHDLAARLAACRARGQDVTVPDGTLAVAEVFCRFSRHDAGEVDLRDAAAHSMEYIGQMLDGEIQRADAVLAGRASYPAIPKPRAVGVTWHDGGLWSGREPVFLSGFNWDAVLTDGDPALARRLGLNLADGMLRGTQKPDGSFDDSALRGGDGQYLGRMARDGFAVDCLLGGEVPQWMADATPGMTQTGYSHYGSIVIDHPRVALFWHDFFDHFMPGYAANPSLFAVDLDNEPAYQGATALTLDNWRAWLQRKYGGVAGLNSAWGTDLGSFADVKRYPSMVSPMTGPWDRAEVDFSQPGVRGAHYDWCAFNEERVTAYYRNMVERIHARSPRVAAHVKAMMTLYFMGSTESRGWPMGLSYHTFGIDAEALARICDLLGGDLGLADMSQVDKPNRFFGSVPYAMDWITAGLTADFLKSVAPEKAFYNSEFHAVENVDETNIKPSAHDHIQAALWLAHLHGMSANLLWYWSRTTDGTVMGHGASWFKGSLLQQPWTLQGYVEETLNLRRFVRPVMAFSQQPRPVRLLYSEASAIQDVKYLDALRDSYEALSFLGVSIGLVTERQLAEGGVPPDTRLLIVPNARFVQPSTPTALRAARRRGVLVGIIGNQSLTAQPTGGPQPDATVPGAETVAIGTPQEYQPHFDAWMSATGIHRGLVAIGPDGRPAWGVEVRTAREGGRRLAYLVNLMRDPVRVSLRWSDPAPSLRDWRTDRSVPDRTTLRPRQVIFGAY